MLKTQGTVFMLNYLFLSILFISTLHSMDLPTFSEPDKKIKILSFYADTEQKEGVLSYIVQWKTVNATTVSITFIGKVDNSGSLIITEDEYNYGPITLTATDEHNVSVTKTIGNEKAGSPIMNSSPKNSHYRTPTPYRRIPYRRPINRRYY